MASSTLPLTPRVVLITGATSGVGLAIAKVLLCKSSSSSSSSSSSISASRPPPYHVIITGRTQAKLDSAVASIQAHAGGGSTSSSTITKTNLTTVILDVNDEGSINAALNFVQQKFQRLDALINNAGRAGLEIDDYATAYSAVFETNVRGPALVAEAFRPLLLLQSPPPAHPAEGHGQGQGQGDERKSYPYSIYIGSRVGTMGWYEDMIGEEARTGQRPAYIDAKRGAPYAVSKAAMHMVMLLEHARFGWQAVQVQKKALKVIAVCPGYVESNLRGLSEEARTGHGRAGDPLKSGELVWSVLEGQLDQHVGKLVGAGEDGSGVFAW